MSHLLRVVFYLLAGTGMLWLGGCSQPKWNSDYNLNQVQLKEGAKSGAKPEDALASGDTAKPSTETSLTLDDGKEEETKKRKKKRNKRYFLGYKVKRGFMKKGRGNTEALETFSYLAEHEEPNAYAPEKYYYDTKQRKIYRTTTTADPERYKVLHGPYKKTVDDETVEEGYYYVGTKHLRWEQYNKNGILVGKTHYDKGFQRDAEVVYYDGAGKQIKEVIPYEYGEVKGTYYRFYENGEIQWAGKYEKGRKVGVWTKYHDQRGRRHFEYQYPETAYEAPAAPVLIKEYDRFGRLIYEKDKFDNRSQAKN
ncbi:toxin-antitoxin system YwqK family antitoxin [Pontibacter harenae]|uniref:toxin-antitoxin system YwqK family antitoxin n=1 Tax=Pontibacter harenae TaxID=2894083 RepID=UPI001E64FBEF|nr:hypothetical protein [Pontibacter harenae]MCC9168465.1 hypothetical protein [Pontibacter harenae]